MGDTGEETEGPRGWSGHVGEDKSRIAAPKSKSDSLVTVPMS